jgi:hypothetical protein
VDCNEPNISAQSALHNEIAASQHSFDLLDITVIATNEFGSGE